MQIDRNDSEEEEYIGERVRQRQLGEKKCEFRWIEIHFELFEATYRIHEMDSFGPYICDVRKLFFFCILRQVASVRLSVQWMTTGTIDLHLFELLLMQRNIHIKTHKKAWCDRKRSTKNGKKIACSWWQRAEHITYAQVVYSNKILPFHCCHIFWLWFRIQRNENEIEWEREKKT